MAAFVGSPTAVDHVDFAILDATIRCLSKHGLEQTSRRKPGWDGRPTDHFDCAGTAFEVIHSGVAFCGQSRRLGVLHGVREDGMPADIDGLRRYVEASVGESS